MLYVYDDFNKVFCPPQHFQLTDGSPRYLYISNILLFQQMGGGGFASPGGFMANTSFDSPSMSENQEVLWFFKCKDHQSILLPI